MNAEIDQKHALLYRTALALSMIILAAVLRIAPHPWNFTPVGAMALFSGAVLKDRRLAFTVALLALFAGDIFLGFYKIQVMIFVYASFLISAAIGLCLRNRRTIGPISLATIVGAFQFFVITDFAFWIFGSAYPHTREGLIECYVAAIPLSFNMLAGDVLYAALLFGGFALAERTFPALREHAFAAR
jgi:uncharacterized protein DUF6580